MNPFAVSQVTLAANNYERANLGWRCEMTGGDPIARLEEALAIGAELLQRMKADSTYTSWHAKTERERKAREAAYAEATKNSYHATEAEVERERQEWSKMIKYQLPQQKPWNDVKTMGED